jgi:hypothetical protein
MSVAKKTLYHQPEEQLTTKTFRMSMCYDTFFFLWSKLLNNNEAILNKLDWTQRVTQYFDDLSMKSACWYKHVYVICILTKTALTLLRECLGVGVGVALGKGKPTKLQPLIYCSINDMVTSIGVAASMPNEFTVNRKQ